MSGVFKQMSVFQYISSIPYRLLGTILIAVGVGTVVLAFINSPVSLQIVLGLIGLGFISTGLLQVKRGQDEKRDKERFDEIMAQLKQIQQELEKEEKPKGTGVAIADIISSGLKYYTEHMNKPKEE